MHNRHGAIAVNPEVESITTMTQAPASFVRTGSAAKIGLVHLSKHGYPILIYFEASTHEVFLIPIYFGDTTTEGPPHPVLLWGYQTMRYLSSRSTSGVPIHEISLVPIYFGGTRPSMKPTSGSTSGGLFKMADTIGIGAMVLT